jgi:hypothetical protein
MMVFRNWFNEQHSKTTSVKVKAGKQISAKNGKFIGAFAPYGYKKTQENRYRLVIDDIAAPIVRKIFEMRASGIGFRAIAANLNDDGITSPRDYFYQSKNIKNPTRTSRLWNENTIKDMVKNEAYIGNMVAGKTGSVSYKNRKLIKKEKDDWIRVESTHEPLVSMELWERVHAFAHKRYKPSRRMDNETNLFVGLLYCNDCGFKLRGQVGRYVRKDNSVTKHVSYMCSTYGRSGKNACTIHGINEKTLIELVSAHIKSYAQLAEYDEKKIIHAVLSERENNSFSFNASYQNELDNHNKHLARLDTLIQSLYEDKVSGLVPGSLFKRQIVKYEQEVSERKQAIKVLEKRIKSIKPLTESTSMWVKLMKKYINMDCLDSETLLLLIDRIIVSEAQYIEGRRICDIKIIYNYVGNIDEINFDDSIEREREYNGKQIV